MDLELATVCIELSTVCIESKKILIKSVTYKQPKIHRRQGVYRT